MNENLKLFRVYDTKAKKYLSDHNEKQSAKASRNEKEHALPHFAKSDTEKGMAQHIIRLDKHYKYRFQIRRAIDHRKGEN